MNIEGVLQELLKRNRNYAACETYTSMTFRTSSTSITRSPDTYLTLQTLSLMIGYLINISLM